MITKYETFSSVSTEILILKMGSLLTLPSIYITNFCLRCVVLKTNIQATLRQFSTLQCQVLFGAERKVISSYASSLVQLCNSRFTFFLRKCTIETGQKFFFCVCMSFKVGRWGKKYCGEAARYCCRCCWVPQQSFSMEFIHFTDLAHCHFILHFLPFFAPMNKNSNPFFSPTLCFEIAKMNANGG